MTAPSRLRALAQAATRLGHWGIRPDNPWALSSTEGYPVAHCGTLPGTPDPNPVLAEDIAKLALLAPDLAVWAADAAEALGRARDTAQIVAAGCDTGHLDFTVEDADALLARLDEITGGKE